MNPGTIYPRIEPKTPHVSEEDVRKYEGFSEREMLILTVNKVDEICPRVKKLEEDMYEIKVKIYSFVGALVLLSMAGGLLWIIG